MTAPRELKPRAWKPVQLELEGRLFFIQADGRVYEKRERNPRTESERKQVADAKAKKKPIPRFYQTTLRRIKDRNTVLYVHNRFVELKEKKQKQEYRLNQIVGSLGIKPGDQEDEPDPAA